MNKEEKKLYMKAYNKAYRAKNFSKLQVKKKEYRRINSKNIKIYEKAFRESNKESIKLYKEQYRKKNSDKIHLKDRNYYIRSKSENGNLPYLIRSARYRAKKGNFPFEISLKYFDILPLFCPLLNVRLNYTHEGLCHSSNSVSIDRIDPTKGYVKGNVWLISFKANSMKNNKTIEDLKLKAFSTTNDTTDDYKTFYSNILTLFK